MLSSPKAKAAKKRNGRSAVCTLLYLAVAYAVYTTVSNCIQLYTLRLAQVFLLLVQHSLAAPIPVYILARLRSRLAHAVF